ncbi:MarR family winged helix-turn-helix transcriptional regulator [Gordonia terrae]|uniref:MarR family winged helix-turn-helix transcriptional regulator n=1 Tax=Gordonia hongkongensis TaxID=1701090 RepID=UPI0022B5D715|nr:MarR family winged helix-turn-helix transcriptional regulator [Gordonia terrae]
MSTPDPRWLNDEERHAWMTLMSLIFRLGPALDTQLRRDAGITHFEYGVMVGLAQTPEHTMRMSVLAALTDGSLSRLSQVVSRLEKAGWVRRTTDPSDGRYTLATLTSAGHAKVEESAPAHVNEARRLVFDPLTKTQVRQLATIGRRILDAISTDDPSPPDHLP